MVYQRTLNNVIRAVGITAHGGQRAELTLRPAPANTGIVFCRTDLAEAVPVTARVNNVGDTRLSTTLVNGTTSISTVEHLMSAFSGLGVDNAYVDVSAAEIPIMDGSSGPFVFLIQSAGLKKQRVPKQFIRIKKAIREEHNDAWGSLKPFKGFKVDVKIKFDHPAFKASSSNASLNFSSSSYIKEFSRARTFGFLADLERLQAANLALGSSLNNAVGFDDFRILNPEGLRYENECAKHKVLDVIGDLYLLGAPVIGAFEGYKTGHTLNNKLLKKLLAHQETWEYVTFEDSEKLPIAHWQPVYMGA
jgi:UDP-3-O-[3-hydroxymyristoyl] N-acetylglucosamine deacetylase